VDLALARSRAWLQTVHRHGDVVLAVALFGLAQVELGFRHPAHDLVGVTRGVLLALATLPLIWRRSHTLPAVAVALVAGGAATWVGGNVDSFYAIVAVSLIGFYSGGAHLERRSWLIAALGCLVFWSSDIRAHHPASEYVASAILVIGPWLAGKALRHQRMQTLQLRQLAADLAAERERAELAAAAAERGRIAREMHDVVAHALTIIAVQADAASAALEVRPALAVAAVDAIRAVSRESLDEMRRVLHVLHDGESAGAQGLSSLRDLDRLIGQARQTGVAVQVETVGGLAGLPASVDLIAYRVVQEALTNVRKYAETAAARVRLDHDAARLTVEVTSGAPSLGVGGASPTGFGLRGLRDRVEAHGGCFEAGPDGAGWRVTATIPVPAPVPAADVVR
jgi:signal transduction histidine kinase